MTSATFSTTATPIGEALLVFTDDGLVAASFSPGDPDAELDRIARMLGVSPVRDDAAAADAVDQLGEYFDGSRREFDVPLDWRLTRGFTRLALEAIREIPYGETAGYGEVAIRAGHPGAARAAGTACATTPWSVIVPVHRVVRADGSLGEYGGRPEVKRFLLDLEGSGAAERVGRPRRRLA